MTRTILNATQQADMALALALAATTLRVTAAHLEVAAAQYELRTMANKYYELAALLKDATAIELVKLPD